MVRHQLDGDRHARGERAGAEPAAVEALGPMPEGGATEVLWRDAAGHTCCNTAPPSTARGSPRWGGRSGSSGRMRTAPAFGPCRRQGSGSTAASAAGRRSSRRTGPSGCRCNRRQAKTAGECRTTLEHWIRRAGQARPALGRQPAPRRPSSCRRLIDAVVPGRRAPRRYGAHDADGSSCVGGERPYDRTDIRRWSSWLENVNCP